MNSRPLQFLSVVEKKYSFFILRGPNELKKLFIAWNNFFLMPNELDYQGASWWGN